MIWLLLGALGAGLVLASMVQMHAGSRRFARRLLWVAVIAPWAPYTTSKSAAEVASGGINPLDYARGAIPVVCIVAAMVTARPLRRGFGRVEIWLTLFLLVNVVSAVWSIDFRVTFLKALVLSVEWLAIGLLVRYYATGAEATRALVSFVHTTLLVVPVVWLVSPGTAINSEGRLQAVLPQAGPNGLAVVAVVGIIALVVRESPRWMLRPVIRPGVMLLFVVLLAATQTRAVIVFGAIAVMVAGWMVGRRRPTSIAAATLLLAAVLALANASADRLETFAERGQSAEGLRSLTGRTKIWDGALDIWSQHPIQGDGYFASYRLGLKVEGLGDLSTVDNTWIESLIGVGLVGTVPLAAFWLTMARRVRRRAGPFSVAVVVLLTLQSFFNQVLALPGFAMVIIGVVALAPVHGRTRSAVPVRASP